MVGPYRFVKLSNIHHWIKIGGLGSDDLTLAALTSPENGDAAAGGSGVDVVLAPVVPCAREDDERVRLFTTNLMEGTMSSISSRCGGETRMEVRRSG